MPNSPVTWLEEFVVNIGISGSQTDPVVTTLSNGNILVAWTTNDDGFPADPAGTDLVGRIFDPLGSPLTGEILLNTAFSLDDESNIDIAALPGGGFVVVYEDKEDLVTSLRLGEFDSIGLSVGSDATIIGDVAGSPSYRNPRIAAASDTSVFIVYEEISGGVFNIRGKIYDPATNTYSDQISLIANPGDNTVPDVAALDNGNFVIVGNNGSADTGIYMRIVNGAGANVLGFTPVDGTQSNAEGDREAVVTALAGGGYAIAWTNTDLDQDVIVAVYSNAGAYVGGGLTDTGSSGGANEPSIVGLADGTFVVLYDNDQTFEVAITRFSATGVRLGNTVVSGLDPDSLSVSALPDGRIAAVWQRTNGEIVMEILDVRDATSESGTMFTGTAGNDVIDIIDPAAIWVGGGAGDDVINTGASLPFRTFDGGDGEDIINVQSIVNDDAYRGGSGNDTIDWSDSGVNGAVFDLENGFASTGDESELMLGFENLVATNGVDEIDGTIGANILDGRDGADNIDGRGGDDILIGGLGADVLNGGSGVDTASYAGSASRVTVRLHGGANTGGEAQGDVLISIENTTGSAFDDSLIGSTAANILNGGAGADYLDGLDGADMLIGGLGADTLIGGLGVDTSDYAGSNAGVTVRLWNGTATGGHAQGDTLTGVENLTGSAFNDTLIGSTAANVLTGGAGNDYLDGLEGADTLVGGAGADRLFGGAGIDTADYAGSNARVTVRLWNGTGVGGHAQGDTLTGVENLTGSAFNDSLIGSTTANVLSGGAGDDYLNGLEGADTLIGGLGVDTADYAGSNAKVTVRLWNGTGLGGHAQGDTLTDVENLTGSAFNDTLIGSTAANELNGGAGNDYLDGLDGADTLIGGLGADTLIGGAGADRFVFTGASGADRVADFGVAAGDIIALDSAIFADFADVMAHTIDTQGVGAQISKSGVVITLTGVTKAQLSAGDFEFVTASAGPLIQPGLESDVVDVSVFDAGPLIQPGLDTGWSNKLVPEFDELTFETDMRPVVCLDPGAEALVFDVPASALTDLVSERIDPGYAPDRSSRFISDYDWII